jgi:hypothetical protein
MGVVLGIAGSLQGTVHQIGHVRLIQTGESTPHHKTRGGACVGYCADTGNDLHRDYFLLLVYTGKKDDD